ncbi:terminase small subunit [Sporosarcina sp. P18a]|uniref:terminase small subunit n=1 Tax=Sporosarcina sp. P18a TaxID=2048259 RepID=UPI000C16F989|nr:terminase small subunit [Sporosarcina sp. P18a]PIC81688.1 terminase small subunit [Sporosarcina sp. P18a]
MKKLNPKQQAFADYYIELGNAEEAALKAGYSKAYARGKSYALLANVGISSYIKKRMEELKSERVADQQEILEYLTSILRGEQTEETLRGIGEGAQTIDDIDVSAKDRIKAAEMLGKRYAMWTEKQQLDVTGAVTFIDDIGDSDGA